ncbi:MAG: hypothetical protein KGD64_05940 [Candidatus Heimdallarchaeota archaeon]|nr:hypothetical protein [Candidatus Heimdallarchaeota archaeon]
MNFVKKFKKTFHITFWEALIALIAIAAFFILEKAVFHGEYHLWLIIMGLIVGIWLAFRPSEWAVEGLNSGAKYVGLSEYVAGILSSLASNLPEAVIAIMLITQPIPQTLTAVVTVLSAAGFNTLILGIAIIISTVKKRGSIDVPEDLEKREAPIIRWAIVALIMTVIFGFSEYFQILGSGNGTLADAVLTKPVAGMLAGSYLFYLIYIVVVKDNNKKMSIKDKEELDQTLNPTKEEEEVEENKGTTNDHGAHEKLSIPMTLIFLVMGFVGIYFGGETLIWSVQQLIPSTQIIVTALILGAVGAIPEHGIAIMSAAKDEIEVGIGNAMGGILQSALLIFGIVGVIINVTLHPFILLQLSAIAGVLWFVKRCIQDGKFDTFEGIMIIMLQIIVFIILIEDIALFPG